MLYLHCVAYQEVTEANEESLPLIASKSPSCCLVYCAVKCPDILRSALLPLTQALALAFCHNRSVRNISGQRIHCEKTSYYSVKQFSNYMLANPWPS